MTGWGDFPPETRIKIEAERCGRWARNSNAGRTHCLVCGQHRGTVEHPIFGCFCEPGTVFTRNRDRWVALWGDVPPVDVLKT